MGGLGYDDRDPDYSTRAANMEVRQRDYEKAFRRRMAVQDARSVPAAPSYSASSGSSAKPVSFLELMQGFLILVLLPIWVPLMPVWYGIELLGSKNLAEVMLGMAILLGALYGGYQLWRFVFG